MRYLFILMLAAGCASAEYAPNWNLCISSGYYPGDKIRDETSGRIATVKALHGASARCSGKHPNLAEVAYD